MVSDRLALPLCLIRIGLVIRYITVKYMKIPRITVIYYHFGYFGICLDLEPVTPPFSCILSSKILYMYIRPDC
jgi:hypothetical protein